MTRDHRLIDELLAVRALDGLDEDGAVRLGRELAAHGDCAECRRLEAGHLEVAGMLPLALDPRPVHGDMADRILTHPQRSDGPAAAPVDEVSARRDGRLGRWQAVAGVAAAVALVLAIVLATRPGSVPVPEIVVPFEGTPGALALAYTPGEPGVLVWGAGLPDPGTESVYELWMIEDGVPIRGACLTPTDGAVAAFVDADLSSAELLAVTVESSECPAAPSTDPIYTAELR
jgi:hypothetical protein